MLYDIRLRIAYEYDTPSVAARTLLRMMPRSLPGQELIGGMLQTDPAPSFRQDGTDFFGNPTTQVAHDEPFSEIAFSFAGRVRRTVAAQELDLSTPLADLGRDVAAVLSLGSEAPHHFLGPSPRVPADARIADYARGVVDPGMSTVTAVRALSDALNGYFSFDPEATEVTTTPSEAFRARRGVCQDISHVMICALRSLGVPAGYVSGFLRTVPPKGQPRLEGADAMHAWVRAWCGAETGWIEIDPTNAIDAESDHIVVAYGRDYSDVAPAKGSARTEGSHRTAHQVDVVPV